METDRKNIFARFEIITMISSLCFVIAVFAMLRTSMSKRDFYIEECSKIAWTNMSICAGRGTIIDKNGVPLAWTERNYDLRLNEYQASNSERLLKIIESETGMRISRDETDPEIIKRNLSPEEIIKVEQLPPNLRAEISIHTRFKRIIVDYPEVRKFIGEIPSEKSPGSGIESAFDARLRGRDGLFRVMLDRNREWIPRTFEWLAPYEKGKDLQLEVSMEEIIKM